MGLRYKGDVVLGQEAERVIHALIGSLMKSRSFLVTISREGNVFGIDIYAEDYDKKLQDILNYLKTKERRDLSWLK